MKLILLIVGSLFVSCLGLQAGTPAGAERIVKEQRMAELMWRQRVLSAPPEQKVKLMSQRPDGGVFGKKMVGEIGNNLSEPWSVKYMVWLLGNHPSLSAQGVKNLMAFVEQSHLNSKHLGEFCIALVNAGDWDAVSAQKMGLAAAKLKFIEAVVDGRQSKVVRGQACLALSGALAKMGDSGRINKRRLELIRKAIIHAADTKVNGVSVAEMAQEEIYRMTKLSKGVVAPDLYGRDSSGRALGLRQYRGKVVVLVFWSSWEQSIEVLDYLRKLSKVYAGKKVQIVGVNRDYLGDLRKIEMAGKTEGVHFSDPTGKLFKVYRVTTSPACFVLDAKGVIQYNGGLGSFVDFTIEALLTPQRR